ncbi:MAG: Fe-S cluster assembly ATP-binding protein [Patescibacteria group bacterium]|jgi:Fe-S cluster assembly ATP-binding protein
MEKKLEIQNLHVEIEGKEILHGLNLTLEKGKVYALMGLNGSGKSTLANTLMGHPSYTITSGKIILDGVDVTQAKPTDKARAGMFLSFQYPQSVSGVSIHNFLKAAVNAVSDTRVSLLDYRKLLKEKMELLGMEKAFIERYLNEGFSGGEKKKAEMLQMLMLDPSLAILDETDSGLDIDALRTISEAVNTFKNKDKTFLIITHYQRMLNHVKPDIVLVMKDGMIVSEGGFELAERLEKEGYGFLE